MSSEVIVTLLRGVDGLLRHVVAQNVLGVHRAHVALAKLLIQRFVAESCVVVVREPFANIF